MAEQKRDYYEVLGVDRGADDATLKKAYRLQREEDLLNPKNKSEIYLLLWPDLSSGHFYRYLLKRQNIEINALFLLNELQVEFLCFFCKKSRRVEITAFFCVLA